MDLVKLDSLVDGLRRRSAATTATHRFSLVEGRTATADENTGHPGACRLPR